MCVDDSICDEFLYNKTRGNLISSCVIKTTSKSGFGENSYHFSAKNLNLQEVMAFFFLLVKTTLSRHLEKEKCWAGEVTRLI